MSDDLIPARTGGRPVPSPAPGRPRPPAKRRAVCLAVLVALAGALAA
jgi:hypothetical protein